MRARTSLLCLASLAVTSLLVSGCSAGGFNIRPPASATQSAGSGSFMSPAVRANGAQLVYLSAFVAGTVYIYDQSGNTQSPIGQIGGLSAPAGVALTSTGDVYVASQSAGTVSEDLAMLMCAVVFQRQGRLYYADPGSQAVPPPDGQASPRPNSTWLFLSLMV